MISMTFVFLRLIRFNILIGISDIIILEFIFQAIVIICSIFVLLFIPTYPLLFILVKKGGFTNFEKLGITIILNSAFYIFLGYFGYWIGISITGLFFFLGAFFTFLIFICYIIVNEFKNEIYIFIKPIRLKTNIPEKLDQFSILDYLKRKVSLNTFLLICFISLICVLNITKFTIFVGTDPWLHI